MREEVEVNRQDYLEAGSRGSGSRGLRIVQPWAPDEAASRAPRRSRADGVARSTPEWRHLALVTAAEVQPPRPSAMLVMRQLLTAWRSAERELAATGEDSMERSQVESQIATLRSLYQGLFVQVRHARTDRAETRGG